jgi:transcriptional regulator GlxA family with amidase domain
VAIEDLLGRAGTELVERLAGLPGWPERFAALDAALAARLEAAEPPAPEVRRAWQRITASGGAVAVEQLAREVGWSRRHLAARFGAEVGVSPKAFARMVRFERVAGLLRAGTPGGLADAAYACGYADQAHLNRDFRAFAGTTPTDFAARVMPDLGGVAG